MFAVTVTVMKAGLKDWIGLAVLALPALLVSIDVSVMILALPHIGAALGADSTQQLWVMDIYGFMLSGFLITMGTLGDRIGRRKLLMIGGAAFGAASIIAAFSQSAGMLIAARALLGIAGATLSPSTLALISNMFHDHKQRSFAIGIWLTCSMGGMALGPVVGGTLLGHFWWGSIFLLAVPVMVLLLILGPFLLPEYRQKDGERVDLLSVGLSLGAILPIVYGFKEAAKHGFQALPIVTILVGLLIGVLFVQRQQRLSSPLLDLRLFTNSAFSTSLACMFGVTMTGAVMLYIAQYLQFVKGLSPLQAGLWMLPGVLGSMSGMLLSPLIARRIRPAVLIGAGLILSAAGCVLLARISPASGLMLLAGGYTLFNLGASPFQSLASDFVVGSAPPEKAGSAASMLQTSGEFAFAVGITVLGSLGTVVYRSRVKDTMPVDIPPSVAQASGDSLASATTAAEGLSVLAADKLLTRAHEAFTSGLNVVAACCCALMLGSAIIAVIRFWKKRPIGTSEPQEPGRISTAASEK
jgi:DHA2 family multidrug resistance protein-like MFS transporter